MPESPESSQSQDVPSSSHASHSVLFVCMGNICRSPTGEGLFRAHVDDQGLTDSIHIDSAGTISYHTGNAPDPRMTAAAARRGHHLEGQARQVRPDDFDRFDLIVAMDRENYSDLMDLGQAREGHLREDHLRLLSSFLPAGSPVDVPDPYYGGAQGFETVLDMIEAACPAILDFLLTTNHA